MEIKLSPTQTQVLDDIMAWYKSAGSGSYLTLGGFAGTGKTTLIGYLRQLLYKQSPKLTVAFCSFTGKATRVLETKLREAKAVYKGDSISTIHSLIYMAVTDDDGDIVGWSRKAKDEFKYDLIIVDEASMVNSDIWSDLTTYGVPILAVGDHGQLPPIGGAFNLMEQPQLRLEEIYRQQEGNPIIRLSAMARNTGTIPHGMYGRTVRKLRRTDPDTQEFLGDLFMGMNEETLVLTGYNHTRVKINQAIRNILEFDSPRPRIGDRIICLRNNHKHKIYNGMLGTLVSINLEKDNSGEFYEVEVEFDGSSGVFKGQASVDQFGEQSTIKTERRKGIDLFDFGYAITVHKAQGSQADTVVVFEERFSKMDDETWRRWLYTAVTRAKENLYIIG